VGPLSLTVQDECVCLSGPSGAGKTLLLRAIADLDPHRGRVFLDEVECNDFNASDWRRQVGLLPAESQWWRDRVGEHFVEPDQDLLTRLNFDADVMQWQVNRLSSGERQRLALARMLCLRPRVLLLDEPTASLDPDNVRCAEEVVAHYRRQTGAAILWVSHDPGQIRRVAGRSYVIEQGKLLPEAEPLCI